jgi:hypothetical protein
VTSLERYVRRVADEMHMKDWEIVLRDEPPEKCAEAFASSTIPVPHGYEVELWFNPHGWRDATPEFRRRFVVHELLHAMIDLLQVGDTTANEVTIRRLERIIAPTMPLPPKVAKP